MLSVEEALAHILSQIGPLETVRVPLAEAYGQVLSEDIMAGEDMPPFANSAMDGFALRSSDSRSVDGKPARLRIIGEVAAGYVADKAVEEGTAMRIMTGAPLPPGADAVIQVELTETHEAGWVEVLREVAPGNNIRPAGEDMRRGQTILSHGCQIGAWEIGILATLGWATVPVVRRARVAILSTGDEIIDIDQPLQPGKIRNSNAYLLEAAVKTVGAQPQRLGIAQDTVESLREKLREASQFDLIISTGGVSVGDYDLVKDILTQEGHMEFWRINMKPGKPLAFGQLAGVPLLGLPGNPVSTAVTFELFGRPLLRKMQGHTRLYKPQIEVVVADHIREPGKRRHYIRAIVRRRDGQFVAHTTGNQGSHIMTSLRDANALLIVPAEISELKPGDRTKAMMLDWPEGSLEDESFG